MNASPGDTAHQGNRDGTRLDRRWARQPDVAEEATFERRPVGTW